MKGGHCFDNGRLLSCDASQADNERAQYPGIRSVFFEVPEKSYISRGKNYCTDETFCLLWYH